MVRLEVRITRDKLFLLAGTTGTVSVPTTADTIDEVDETFSIANGTVSATGILSTITMHRLWQRSLLLRLPKDLMW
jgi:hypothetical protein